MRKALLSITINEANNSFSLENGQSYPLSTLRGCQTLDVGAVAEASTVSLADFDGEEATIVGGSYNGYNIKKVGGLVLYKTSASGRYQEVPNHIDQSSIQVQEA